MLITAIIDTPKVSAISEIVLRIATTYPQAIMYSYRLSKENYRNTQSTSTDETKFLIDQLDRLLLNDPLVDKFLAGIYFCLIKETIVNEGKICLIHLTRVIKSECSISHYGVL